MWDNLPITNSYEDMIDEGVCKGFVNGNVWFKKPEMKHINYLIIIL